MLTEAGDHPRAENEVAYRAGPRPAWPGQPCGDHAADRGAVGKGWRFAGQHLPGVIHRREQLGQRRTGAHRDHQLRRVVLNDAAMSTGVEHFAGHLAAEKGLAVAALNLQRRGIGPRGVDLIEQGVGGIEISHQNRSSSGKGSCPA